MQSDVTSESLRCRDNIWSFQRQPKTNFYLLCLGVGSTIPSKWGELICLGTDSSHGHVHSHVNFLSQRHPNVSCCSSPSPSRPKTILDFVDVLPWPLTHFESLSSFMWHTHVNQQKLPEQDDLFYQAVDWRCWSRSRTGTTTPILLVWPLSSQPWWSLKLSKTHPPPSPPPPSPPPPPPPPPLPLGLNKQIKKIWLPSRGAVRGNVWRWARRATLRCTLLHKSRTYRKQRAKVCLKCVWIRSVKILLASWASFNDTHWSVT